jgi:hypothetical protein
MIRIFNSGTWSHDKNRAVREIEVSDVTVESLSMDYTGAPYIIFSHPDFPLGSLKALYDGHNWNCDMD